MSTANFLPWPAFTNEEAAAVQRVLLSNRVNYWTGDEGRQFESEFAEWVGVQHAIALANGTLALELALRALGLGPGDEVIVSPRSFMASASCIVAVGAVPVFVDVDENSQNITAETITVGITSRTRAILCVHLAGMPCEMDPIIALAAEHDLLVIEDCAQAHGARYRGRPVGSIGHIGAWSFCQDKIMSTGGEGGMVTCNDSALWKRMWAYKDHGKSWQAVNSADHPPGFRWLHESFGSNYRMTEMQAAIGRVQIQRMPRWHELRQRNAQVLMSAAAACDLLRVPVVPEHVDHAWYKAYVFLESGRLKQGWSRDRIMAEVQARGVPCFSGSCPEIYLEKAFENTGWRPSRRLPAAKKLGETSLMFLVHPTLGDAEMARSASVLVDVCKAALL